MQSQMFETGVPNDAGVPRARVPATYRSEAYPMLLPGAGALTMPPKAWDLLTPREIEVLSWIAVGKSDWQIGQILLISPKTVNYHVERAKQKFSFATRIQVVVSAARHGLLDRPLPLMVQADAVAGQLVCV